MPKNMELEVVTSTADVFKAKIKELYIPAYLGKAGVLENHLPYISLLNPDLTRDDLISAAKTVNAHSFIMAMAQAMDGEVVVLPHKLEHYQK